MTVYFRENFSKRKISRISFQDGDEFIECNFSQISPHTSIGNNKTGLSFTDCNLFNCDVPADATVIGCQRIQKDCCSNLHPTWGLPICSENCSHVVDTDIITIDSQVVDTIYHYEDTEES